MLDTLKLYSAILQLHLNKTEKIKKTNKIETTYLVYDVVIHK